MLFETEFSGHFYFPAYIYLYSFETVCECIVAQLCLNLYNPIGRTIVYQAPLSMVILQERILEWFASTGIEPSSSTLQEGSLPSEPLIKFLEQFLSNIWSQLVSRLKVT